MTLSSLWPHVSDRCESVTLARLRASRIMCAGTPGSKQPTQRSSYKRVHAYPPSLLNIAPLPCSGNGLTIGPATGHGRSGCCLCHTFSLGCYFMGNRCWKNEKISSRAWSSSGPSFLLLPGDHLPQRAPVTIKVIAVLLIGRT